MKSMRLAVTILALCLGLTGPAWAAIPGDANNDGVVDLADFVLLKSNFGTSPGATWDQGDFNGDGNVDLSDFVILKTNFGKTAPTETELLVNGDFEIGYPGGTSQLGLDVIRPVLVSDDPAGDWESICVGEWVRSAAGNWQDAPDGTGNDSGRAAVVRKTAQTMQVTAKGSVNSGDTLTLNWDYRAQPGVIVGPTFAVRILGVNQAGSGETPTELANFSPTSGAITTVTGEAANWTEIGASSVTVSADDPTIGAWQSATTSTFLVEETWDYICVMFGRTAGDNNTSGNEMDNISLTVTRGDGPLNRAPRADAGADQAVIDADDDGSESVTLDGSTSSDDDGTIVSYTWEENATQIATGATATLTMDLGTHTITLTVTDDDDATDSDTVEIVVEGPPPANGIFPAAAWDGTAGSGYPAEPTESTAPIGTGTAKAIALWDVVPNQIVSDDFAVGVVAFHHEGIDRVEFLCEGNQTVETQMTLNERTGATEYTAVLDISEFDNGANGDGLVTLYARVIPNSGYERLISLDLCINPDGTLFGGDVGKVLYVCNATGDDARTVTQAQNPATPLATLKTAVDRAATIATYGDYGGNGVIIEILTPGFYPFNRPNSNYAKAWITVRPTDGLTRDDVSIGAAGNEIEWPSLNFKSPIKFENITIDASYWMTMNGHWAENCLYTDPRGCWHAGGGGTWEANTRTLTSSLLLGYDHAERAAIGQNFVWIRGGDAGVVPGVYEIESKIADDAIVLAQSCSPVDLASVSWGRGHDLLRTNHTAYAVNCDFIDLGSGPSDYAIVRDCYAEKMSGDFMKEWKLVVNSEVRQFHGAWSGAMHSDIFQRIAAAENCILYGFKATEVDKDTQMLFFENSATTIGGNGQHDNWAMVNCMFVGEDNTGDPPYTQFCRRNDHVVMVNNLFLGQATAFRGGGDEAFVPVNGLITQNIFNLLHFTEENLSQAVVDNNHYILRGGDSDGDGLGDLPAGDLNQTDGYTIAELFTDPANNDFTPLSPILLDRAVPLVPIDLTGAWRLNPTAIGPIEKTAE